MSWTLEVNSKVLYLPEQSLDLRGYERPAKELFWFIKIGSNNVSPFSPDWTFQKNGENYQIVQEVCRQAGFCEGGSRQFGTHPSTAQWIRPEDYLAHWREKSAAKQVLTLSSLKSVRHDNIGFGNVKRQLIENAAAVPAFGVLDDYRRRRVLEAIAVLTGDYEREEEMSLSPRAEKTFAFRLKITKIEDFLHWIEMGEIFKPFGVWAIHG